MKNFLKFSLFVTLIACIVACSDKGVDSAGIIIETNTGKKTMARMYVSTSQLGLIAGDTLVIQETYQDTLSDTIYVSKVDYSHYVTPLEFESGVVMLDSVPVGEYDSIQIHSANGVTMQPVDWQILEGVQFGSGFAGAVTGTAKISIPEEFSDVATSSEIFRDMPFAVQVPQMKNPCLIDQNENLILLTAANSNSEKVQPDSNLYWGVMPQVYFTEGAIEFKVVENCQATDRLELALARYSNHFDDFDGKGLWGNALKSDSTSEPYLINDFIVFDEGYSMAASFWIKMDSLEQALPGNSYTKILAAKADSVGFTVQQRGSHGSINLRIDARSGGAGDYQKTFGTANVLDGSWHNYAFTIRGDSLFILCDGNVIADTTFDSGNGFKNVQNPLIGNISPNIVGLFDELYFFDGTQSKNWMRLFYALQAELM